MSYERVYDDHDPDQLPRNRTMPVRPPTRPPGAFGGPDQGGAGSGSPGASAAPAKPAPPKLPSAGVTRPVYQPGSLNYAKDQVQRAYQDYLGREGSDAEVLSHLGGGRNYADDNIGHAVQTILNSDEALSYAQQRQGAATGGGTSSTTAKPGETTAPDRVAGGAFARYGTGNIPGAENLTWGNAGTLRGFNTAEWGDGGTEGYEDASIKNSFGKIASRYPAKPSSIAQIFADPDFQRLFPEATIVEGGAGDKIDFGDGAPVDVLEGADPNADASTGWQWGVEDGSGAAPAPGDPGDPSQVDLAAILGGEDPMDDILKRIQDLQGGVLPEAEQDALIRLLRGEQAA